MISSKTHTYRTTIFAFRCPNIRLSEHLPRRPPPRVRDAANLPSSIDLVHDEQIDSDMVQTAVDLGLKRRPHHGQVAVLTHTDVWVPDPLLEVVRQRGDAVDVRVDGDEAERHHGRSAQRHPACREAAFFKVGAGLVVEGREKHVCH